MAKLLLITAVMLLALVSACAGTAPTPPALPGSSPTPTPTSPALPGSPTPTPSPTKPAQELKPTILGFSLSLQTSNKITVHVGLSVVESPVRNAVYGVSTVVDGIECDNTAVVLTEGRISPGDVYLNAQGASVARMLAKLGAEYGNAFTLYKNLVDSREWQLLVEGQVGSLTQEQIKELYSREAYLKKQLDKWDAWRVGKPLGYDDEFDTFCKTYITVGVRR